MRRGILLAAVGLSVVGCSGSTPDASETPGATATASPSVEPTATPAGTAPPTPSQSPTAGQTPTGAGPTSTAAGPTPTAAGPTPTSAGPTPTAPGGTPTEVTPTPSQTLSPTPTLAPAPPVHLYISEYVEGSGTNHAVEFHNPNGEAVLLNGYLLVLAVNGTSFETSTRKFNLSGELAADGLFVVCDNQSSQPLLARCNVTASAAMAFNGDDALALYYGDTLVDVIGRENEQPSNGWTVAGEFGATRGHTLSRRFDVQRGNVDWTSSAGTTAENSEWVVLEEDFLEDLGLRREDPSYVATPTPTASPTPIPTPTPVPPEVYFSEYVEAVGSNHAFELHNPKAEAVDLRDYSVALATNGERFVDATYLDMDGFLGPNEVLVVCDPAADTSVQAVCDIDFSPVGVFNGDDALGLFRGQTLIDVIGVEGEAPVGGWTVAGVPGATVAHTLVRRYGTRRGETSWPLSAGTTPGDSQWVVRSNSDISDLGGRADVDWDGTVPTPTPAPTPTATPTPTAALMPPLYFSEYVEGSNNNKAYEIYNPSSAPTDLNAVVIALCVNGEPLEGSDSRLVLAGTLGAHETWVVCNGSVSSALSASCDQINNTTTVFNGNDALVLLRDGEILDTFGQEGMVIAGAWQVAGVATAGVEHTVRRKLSVAQGNPNWAASAGTTTVDSEWNVYGQDVFSDVGTRGE